MDNKNKIQLRTLAGIEFNIEVLILVILWIYNLKTAFWILLVLALIGVILKLKAIEEFV